MTFTDRAPRERSRDIEFKLRGDMISGFLPSSPLRNNRLGNWSLWCSWDSWGDSILSCQSLTTSVRRRACVTASPGGLAQCRVCSENKRGSELVCSRIACHFCLLGKTLTSGHLASSFSKWERVETPSCVSVALHQKVPFQPWRATHQGEQVRAYSRIHGCLVNPL